MTAELIVLLGGTTAGSIVQNRQGRLTFTYDESWRQGRGAYPLSLSMPLARREHSHDVVSSFIWGLLPDNEYVLGKWAQKFQVSARNPFALIAHVGEDCAGAVQFVRPDRLDAALGSGPGAVDWLDETGIAQRLSELRADNAAWRSPHDTGQFSLPGAQPKTALLSIDGRWGVPSGRMPTTHILKPVSAAFDGHVENEHFCLELARAAGLPAAASEVMRFGDEIAFVTERYDRAVVDGSLIRVHQEDTCQALGIPPTRKYENEGGPGVAAIVQLIRESSGAAQDDVTTFIDAVAFHWLTGGTDAHAKNYSLLIGRGGRARLAPLYDLASILPYAQFDLQKIRLAMKLGGKYRFRDITARSWSKLAAECRLEEDELKARVAVMARALPDLAAAIAASMKAKGLTHPIIERLRHRITEHAAGCQRSVS